jgi:hypothetical protein
VLEKKGSQQCASAWFGSFSLELHLGLNRLHPHSDMLTVVMEGGHSLVDGIAEQILHLWLSLGGCFFSERWVSSGFGRAVFCVSLVLMWLMPVGVSSYGVVLHSRL